ncbi:MAG TPA: ROK family protein [Candidatus Dormibacteraeota bacterium]|jgi:glucokinase
MPVSVGVDLGGTKVQTVVLRARRVIGQGRSRTPEGGADAVTDVILATIDQALASAGVGRDEVAGIGIGFPGQFDPESGDTLSAVNLKGFQDRYPLGSRVSKAVHSAPVVLDNDVRAALSGEYRLGSGRGYRNLLGVFVGTGVGGGLVLEGKLRRGRGAAGEIGHTVVKDGGRECGCGRRGCLEAYAGRGRMELRARDLVKQGKKTSLFDIMERKRRDRLTSGVIVAALEQNDAVATALVDDAVWALGVSLASVQNALDLEAIIIGGGLGDRLGVPFIKRVAAAMQPHLFMDKAPPAMLPTTLGDLSGAVGAALLVAGVGNASTPS